MKKFILSAIIMGVAVTGVFSDPLLYWGSDQAFGGTDQVLYTNGVAIAQGSDWLIELVNVADDSVLYSTTSGFLAGDGLFFETPDASGWNGLSVKSVIYNAPTKQEAGLFAEFTFVGAMTWSDVPAPPATFNYNAGGVTAVLGTGAGQWQAIPEPAVVSLIAIFGSGLFAGRRFFAKA